MIFSESFGKSVLVIYRLGKSVLVNLSFGKKCPGTDIFLTTVVNREEVEIDFGGRVLQQARSAKFLEILIDDRLSFNQHTIALRKKRSCALGFMYKMSGYAPGHVLRMMYYSLFYPHLFYGLSVWGGCGATNFDKINRIQLRALSLIEERYCTNIPLSLQPHEIFAIQQFQYSILC